jgi:Fe-S-cluster containining protein
MSLPACCLDLELELRQLLFPETLDDAGREFVAAHGLETMPLYELRGRVSDLGLADNGERRVKLRHRCQHLQDDGRCGIYDNRPTICRDFDCAVRHDCACLGRGVMSEIVMVNA